MLSLGLIRYRTTSHIFPLPLKERDDLCRERVQLVTEQVTQHAVTAVGEHPEALVPPNSWLALAASIAWGPFAYQIGRRPLVDGQIW